MEEYQSVEQIDEYIVTEEIGHGAQGLVYRAQSQVTKELVAIKEIREMNGKIVSQQAKQEIAVMKKLKHPNLIRMLQVYEPSSDISSSIFSCVRVR